MKYSYDRKDMLDRFYTKPDVAKECVSHLELKKYNKIIEPSAGDGAFVDAIRPIKQYAAYDIDPTKQWTVQDFLTTEIKPDNILIVGNPPFGKQGSLAIKFINHSAKFASSIAFILPNSFSKESVLSKVDPYFHLEGKYELPENAFLFSGEDYNVPCSFFIFNRNKNKRACEKKETTNLFFFVKKEEATISVRRVGVNAGKITENLSVSESSNYFIKPNINKDMLVSLFEQRFDAAFNTSGPPSLSKNEMIRETNRRFKQNIFLRNKEAQNDKDDANAKHKQEALEKDLQAWRQNRHSGQNNGIGS